MNTNCDRCSEASISFSMSWFNGDFLCAKCAEEEKEHPLFELAKHEEHEQVRLGINTEDKEQKKKYFNYDYCYEMTWEEFKKETPVIFYDLKKIRDFNERQIKVSQIHQEKPRNFISFLHNDVSVINPFYDENGTNPVNPMEYYGEKVMEQLINDFNHSFAVLLEK